MDGGSFDGAAGTQSTSSSLIVAAQAHDPRAWDQLAELYGPLVYQWSRGTGLQPSDAADVMQEVFRKLQGALDHFEHRKPKQRFRAWLATDGANCRTFCSDFSVESAASQRARSGPARFSFQAWMLPPSP